MQAAMVPLVHVDGVVTGATPLGLARSGHAFRRECDSGNWTFATLVVAMLSGISSVRIDESVKP